MISIILYIIMHARNVQKHMQWIGIELSGMTERNEWTNDMRMALLRWRWGRRLLLIHAMHHTNWLDVTVLQDYLVRVSCNRLCARCHLKRAIITYRRKKEETQRKENKAAHESRSMTHYPTKLTTTVLQFIMSERSRRRALLRHNTHFRTTRHANRQRLTISLAAEFPWKPEDGYAMHAARCMKKD